MTFVGRETCDLSRPEQAARVVRNSSADAVIIAAAYTAVDKAESEPDLAARVNSDAPAAVADACKLSGKMLAHVSTDFVFDGEKREAYLESDPVAPLSVYGRTKADGERRVLAACPEAVVARTSWVFSGFGTDFVGAILGAARAGKSLSVVEDQIGRPTYAPDLALALLQIVDARLAGKGEGGVLHLAGEGTVSRLEQARAVLDAAGLTAPVAPARSIDRPTPAKRPLHAVLGGARAEQLFGVVMPSWRPGLIEAVRRLSI